MAQELTYLNLLDTSIKIGLGAIITALSGYLVLSKNRKTQIENEYRDDKRKCIDGLLEVVGNSSSRALVYWSYLNDREINKARGVGIPEHIENDLQKSSRIFHASFEKITLLEGKYYLVADKEKYEILIDYAQFLAKTFWSFEMGDMRRIQEWPSIEKMNRENLLASIKEVYFIDKKT